LTLRNYDVHSIWHGHQVSLTALALDVEHSIVVTGSYDGVVNAWKGATATRMGGSTHNTAKISCMDILNGLVARGGWDDTVRFGHVVGGSSAQTCTYTSSVPLNGAQPLDLALATYEKNGPMLCAVATNKGVKVLVNDSIVYESPVVSCNWTPTCIAVSPSGTQVAVGADDLHIHLYDVVLHDHGGHSSFHLQETAPLTGHLGALTSLAYSPNGNFLAAGDAYRDVRVWDMVSRSAVVAGQWVFHTTRVTSVAWSPSGNFVASGSLDEHVIVWNVTTPSKRHKFDYAHKDGVMSVKFMADDQVISIGNDACIRTWRVPAF
jgi:WD40 repeat protein